MMPLPPPTWEEEGEDELSDCAHDDSDPRQAEDNDDEGLDQDDISRTRQTKNRTSKFSHSDQKSLSTTPRQLRPRPRKATLVSKDKESRAGKESPSDELIAPTPNSKPYPLTAPHPDDSTVRALAISNGRPTSDTLDSYTYTTADLARYRKDAEAEAEAKGTKKPFVSIADGAWRKWSEMGGISETMGRIGRYPYDEDGQVFKPEGPYTLFIRLVLASHPRKCMTLSQIYDAIEQRWPFYATQGSTWRNTVRHNLSLSHCFKNIDRPSDEGYGKGGYWTIADNTIDGRPRIRKKTTPPKKASPKSASATARRTTPASSRSLLVSATRGITPITSVDGNLDQRPVVSPTPDPPPSGGVYNKHFHSRSQDRQSLLSQGPIVGYHRYPEGVMALFPQMTARSAIVSPSPFATQHTDLSAWTSPSSSTGPRDVTDAEAPSFRSSVGDPPGGRQNRYSTYPTPITGTTPTSASPWMARSTPSSHGFEPISTGRIDGPGDSAPLPHLPPFAALLQRPFTPPR